MVRLEPAYDSTPQLATVVEVTGDPDVFSFTSEPFRGGEWSVAGKAARTTNGLVIRSLDVRASDAATSGVTGNMLRKIPVGVILNHVRGDVRRLSPQHLEAESPERAPRRGGRTALTDDLLRSVAEAYLRETAADRPSGALRRMAAEFERPEGTIRTWLARARADGWLGPSVKGRAGAEPGPKLAAVQLADFKRKNPGAISHVEVAADGTVTDVSEPRQK